MYYYNGNRYFWDIAKCPLWEVVPFSEGPLSEVPLYTLAWEGSYIRTYVLCLFQVTLPAQFNTSITVDNGLVGPMWAVLVYHHVIVMWHWLSPSAGQTLKGFSRSRRRKRETRKRERTIGHSYRNMWVGKWSVYCWEQGLPNRGHLLHTLQGLRTGWNPPPPPHTHTHTHTHT